jgi:hypothetical protein
VGTRAAAIITPPRWADEGSGNEWNEWNEWKKEWNNEWNNEWKEWNNEWMKKFIARYTYTVSDYTYTGIHKYTPVYIQSEPMPHLSYLSYLSCQ